MAASNSPNPNFFLHYGGILCALTLRCKIYVSDGPPAVAANAREPTRGKISNACYQKRYYVR